VALTLTILLLVGVLTCLYFAWKIVPRLFRWMVADNDIHKSLRRTLVFAGCGALVSLLIFFGRSNSGQIAPVVSGEQISPGRVSPTAQVGVRSTKAPAKPPDVQKMVEARALAAITSAPDVKLIGPTQNMFVMPYGPCGIVEPIGKVWVWSGEPSPSHPPDGYLTINDTSTLAYYTKEDALAAAFDGCEQQYKRMKSERDFDATRSR